MERHRRKHSGERRAEDVNGRSYVTLFVIIATIVLIIVMICLSPLGPTLKEHVVEPIAEIFRQNKSDSMIVSALKNQDEKTQTVSPSPTATPVPNQKEVLSVRETSFYILQMGTYLEEQAAKEHAAQIRQMGAAGVVVPDGSVYRVFAAAYADEDSLSKVQVQVRADGFEATPYINDSHTVKITLEGSDQGIADTKDAVAFLAEVPQSLCEISLAFDKQTLSIDEVRSKLAAMQSKAEIILNTFSVDTKDQTLKPILTVIEKYRDHISTFLKEHGTISMYEQAGFLKQIQIETIVDYIQFFNRE